MKQIKIPHTLVLIFGIILLMAILTWIVPGGQYDRKDVDGRTMLVPDSFIEVESDPQGLGAVLKAPLTGFVQAANIIAFILIVGGAFSIIQATGTIDALIGTITRAHKKSKIIRMGLIPILMFLFSFFGAVFGMSEEVIPFIMIFVPLAISLGYDSIVGAAIPFVGAGLGFAGAFLNPFTIGIAQGIAELPPFSGIIYRIIVWFIITIVGVYLISRYAKKISHNPEKSPVYELDEYWRKKQSNIDDISGMEFSHRLILVLFLGTIVFLIFGVLYLKWYISEIAALFFGLGILVGLLGRLNFSKMASSFVDGAKDLVLVAFVVAFARAILVVATDGQIIDTILHGLSGMISSIHPIFAGQMMFFVQMCINFLVPSGSGQAALTMPIMAPLSDLVGVTRQTAVLAFQFGDGFTNLIIPTSGITMGVLGIARIPWEKWARWIIPFEIILFILGLTLLIPPVLLNWGPF